MLPTDLIPTTEAAKLADCHASQVHRWVLAGKLRGWKRCGRVFVSREEVLGLFEPVPVRPKPGKRYKTHKASVEFLRKRGYPVPRDVGRG